MQACRDRGKDTYFLAADNDAFGKDELHTELASEVAAVLGEGAARFRPCRGVEGLLERFAVTTLVMQLSDAGEIAAAVVTGMSQLLDVRADVLGKSSTGVALSGEDTLTVG